MPEQLPNARYCVVCGHGLIDRLIEAEGRRRLQCENCGHIHYVNPRVVTGIVIEHTGRVLLQQQRVASDDGVVAFVQKSRRKSVELGPARGEAE